MTLEEARLSNNWSLEDASSAFGLDVETLIQYESGTEIPDMWTLNLILGVLDLDYKDIILNKKLIKHRTTVK